MNDDFADHGHADAPGLPGAFAIVEIYFQAMSIKVPRQFAVAYLLDALRKKLTHVHVISLRGQELYAAKRDAEARGQTPKKVKYEFNPLYTMQDERDFVVFKSYAGLAERACDALESFNFKVTVRMVDELKWPEPNMYRVSLAEEREGHPMREHQRKALELMCRYRRAQIDAGTGFGKTFLMGMVCAAYSDPGTQILIVSPSIQLMHDAKDRIEHATGEQVGQLGDGKKKQLRITSTTIDSIGAYDDLTKVKLCLCDEVHVAGTIRKMNVLVGLMRARMFGLSASTNKRADGGNLLIEAVFGKVKVKVPFAECLKEGYVPPVKSTFYTFNVPNRSDDIYDDSLKKRKLVQRGEIWNAAVVRAARYWADRPEKPRILILCETVEHMIRLARRGLDDFVLMYAHESEARLEKMRKLGEIDDDYIPLDSKEAKRRIKLFKSGEYRVGIGHAKLGTGLNIPDLDIVMRADGGSGDIRNAQFRGRVTRGSGGHYIDFLPIGDPWMEKNGKIRYKSCKSDGWEMATEELSSLPEIGG